MTLHPQARHGAEALSHQIDKGGPIPKPERRKKGPKGLARTQLKGKPSTLRRGLLGHASVSQKAKIRLQGCRLTAWTIESGSVHPAHVVDRGVGGCDSELCVIGLRADLHREYDRHELDILPYLTLEEQAHAVSHVGLLAALKRTTGETYLPESEADRRVEAVYREAGA